MKTIDTAQINAEEAIVYKNIHDGFTLMANDHTSEEAFIISMPLQVARGLYHTLKLLVGDDALDADSGSEPYVLG